MTATTVAIQSIGSTVPWDVRLSTAKKKREEKSSFNFDNFALVNTASSGIRSLYVAVAEIWKTQWIQRFITNPQTLHSIEDGYARCGNFINISRLFNAVGLISYVPRLYKASLKVLEKERTPLKRFDQGIKAIFYSSMIGESFATVVRGFEAVKLSLTSVELGVKWLDTALKTAFTWATTLWIYSVWFSVASMVMNARSWWKTREFAIEFMKTAGYKEDGKYTTADYVKLKEFFNISDDKNKENHLKRYFQVDSEILAGLVETAFKNGIKTEDDMKNMEKMMDLLKDRIKTVQKNHLVSFIGNLGSFISCAMVITSFLHPLGYVGLGIYSAAMIGNFIYKKISAYNFETSIGMINRDENDPLHVSSKANKENTIGIKERIFDFASWLTCGLTYYKKPTQEEPEATGGLFSTEESSTNTAPIDMLSASQRIGIQFKRVPVEGQA